MGNSACHHAGLRGFELNTSKVASIPTALLGLQGAVAYFSTQTVDFTTSIMVSRPTFQAIDIPSNSSQGLDPMMFFGLATVGITGT